MKIRFLIMIKKEFSSETSQAMPLKPESESAMNKIMHVQSIDPW